MNLNEITEARIINERMERFYGFHVANNVPNYRVIFASEALTERRSGEFDVYSGDIFLRQETGIREVEKYPWLRGQWVIEGLIPNPHKDVYDGDYIYNPLYAFPEGLPLRWEPILAFMNSLFSFMGSKRTQKDVDAEESLRIAARKAELRNKLEDIKDPSDVTFRDSVILGHEK